MPGFLLQACAEARDRVAAAARDLPADRLRARAAAAPPPAGFGAALAAPGTALIAEVKRASPSRGWMADIPDPAALARAYAAGGARAVSVLTEPAHFGGALDDLRAVAAAVDVPVLRKDFVVDAYQVWEARAAGAAAVLLIVAALDQDRLTGLVRTAAEAGLDALVEAHDEDEVVRAADAHARAATGRRLILGINARDLSSLAVDRRVFARVRAAAEVPDDVVLIAESGVRGPADVAAYAADGADAVLVGEHVATATDPATAVAGLLAPREVPQ